MYQESGMKKEAAVSPVVGVMLMLVVTIIVAAIVSGMAGGLVSGTVAAPSATFDVELTDDSVLIKTISLSEEIPSKDLKIILTNSSGVVREITSALTTTDGMNTYPLGVPFGFNVVESGSANNASGFKDSSNVSSNDLQTTQAGNHNNYNQWFGSYTLKAGSAMSASRDAFIDFHGEPLPYGLKRATWSKSEFYAEITASQWSSIFDANPATETDLGGDPTVLKINLGTQLNPDLATQPQLSAYVDADGKTTKKLYAKSSDTDWKISKTIKYGSGQGGFDVKTGEKVSVTIYHIPSGQMLFAKSIIVKGE